MEVIGDRLRATGAGLHELAASLRAFWGTDLAGPDEPGWATDAALSALAAGWDTTLAGLAARLADAGDRLIRAADGYAGTDGTVGRLLW